MQPILTLSCGSLLQTLFGPFKGLPKKKNRQTGFGPLKGFLTMDQGIFDLSILLQSFEQDLGFVRISWNFEPLLVLNSLYELSSGSMSLEATVTRATQRSLG